MSENSRKKKLKIYPLKYYTKTGHLTPPIFFYIGLIFLARTWMLLIFSLASRETGEKVLLLLMPDRHYFYWGLASGFLSIILLALSGREYTTQSFFLTLWKKGYFMLVVSIIFDLGLQLYYLNLDHFRYSLFASFQLVFIIWLLLYCFKSKHLKQCFT